MHFKKPRRSIPSWLWSWRISSLVLSGFIRRSLFAQVPLARGARHETGGSGAVRHWIRGITRRPFDVLRRYRQGSAEFYSAAAEFPEFIFLREIAWSGNKTRVEAVSGGFQGMGAESLEDLVAGRLGSLEKSLT